MDTCSVQVTVRSNNTISPIVVVPNELQLLPLDSTDTVNDLLSKLSPKSPLLTHILTYIQCSCANKKRKDARNNKAFPNYSKFLKIYGIIFNGKGDDTKCQISNMNEKIAPLSIRHKFDQIAFEISHELVAQSTLFLHNMTNMNSSVNMNHNHSINFINNGTITSDPRASTKNYNMNGNQGYNYSNRISKGGNEIEIANQGYYPFSPYAKHTQKQKLNPNFINTNNNNNNNFRQC